eukprot:5751337-Karenia_brevis.AAC.1
MGRPRFAIHSITSQGFMFALQSYCVTVNDTILEYVCQLWQQAHGIELPAPIMHNTLCNNKVNVSRKAT